MIITIKVFAAIYGMLAVIFGAFGAHALKKIFTDEQLKNFETGVKYQMYHAIVLLVLGFNFNFATTQEIVMGYAFIIGIFLFSFSIYGLCISSAKGKKMKFLGPITPLGGLGLVLGWALLLLNFLDL
ncbi:MULTISPECIES: DUF423 domain-containing protein [unclassified Cellulophaga]|uniref:DUF423 domain-containing protein n=1 Tax=unclassified Cellulophaga TaxID=2634405 RepID=UPI0026E276B6|nr:MULTISPECIES: DUF423 domain-containing protein [unclassified Cellulophaga]MDO6490082.1 DUF423 domain-containing protein [Cellulophaga sp. 2_MG-2023]MDO6494724.1 DUF423 domain-containing protein [Cellulophaga sp. 3_MG-2023]